MHSKKIASERGHAAMANPEHLKKKLPVASRQLPVKSKADPSGAEAPS